MPVSFINEFRDPFDQLVEGLSAFGWAVKSHHTGRLNIRGKGPCLLPGRELANVYFGPVGFEPAICPMAIGPRLIFASGW